MPGGRVPALVMHQVPGMHGLMRCEGIWVRAATIYEPPPACVDCGWCDVFRCLP